MPIRYARSLTGQTRTAIANRHLGVVLAFIAGAINAGGFLAVQQYTSHMTGIVSGMADYLVIGDYTLVWAGLGAVLAFLLGAVCTSLMTHYSQRRGLQSEYAWPLMLEAALLLCFGFLGARLAEIDGFYVPLTVLLLCFIMGLQNALITKVSRAEIRTTHITGIVTDLGIELGKLFYWNRSRNDEVPRVIADNRRLWLLSLLGFYFFLGGVTGALGFKHMGYISTVPLAIVLVLLASVPVLDDALNVLRRWLGRNVQ